MELSISNVINISVAQPGVGAGQYNTSNLAIFTAEPYGPGFGSLGYKIYLEPTEVASDFGSDSVTYKQALAVFSQQPNILANGGYLVVIPLGIEEQSITPSAAPASGTYELNFDGDVTAAIDWDATAAEIQDAIRTLTGLENATVTGTLATAVTVTFAGYYGDAPLMTVTNNTLNGGITLLVAEETAGESLSEGITRTVGLVQYFGVMASNILAEGDLLDAAEVLQPLKKIGFFVQNDPDTLQPAGTLDLLATGGFTHSRGLYYNGSITDPLVFQAAYAGRGLSTNFDGSNTTQTMHLKDLASIQPDDSMTQTLLNLAIDAGADTYPSIQGIPKVFCVGANDFFDNVYNLLWFVGDLEISGFNYLAQTSTKIPQTESGMDGLKGAYRNVCEQGVVNQFLAPGAWQSPTTFGNQADLLLNVSQRGYYIYSVPVSQQSPADRAARKAPLVQIAIKYAGAIHSSTVIVNVNA